MLLSWRPSLDTIRTEIEKVAGAYDKFVYEVSATTLVEDHQQRISKGLSIESSFNQKRRGLESISHAQSIIIFSIFTDVAADYFYSHEIIPKIVSHLNEKFRRNNIWFNYDENVLDRKQYAMRAGVGKLAKPSLIFHYKYGLNCKFELLSTNLKFKERTVVEEESPVYENCIGCPAPCESNCPQNCRMNFALIDWKKCENFIDNKDMFMYPDRMCRKCQDSCPFSEELKEQILQTNPKAGGYMKDLKYYEDFYSEPLKIYYEG
jgi:hypothetical protein